MWLWSYFAPRLEKQSLQTVTMAGNLAAPVTPHPTQAINLELHRIELTNHNREQAIARVTAFMQSYGSPLAPYAHIIVDQAKACGGSYKVLVGIAGSESGLGRINVLQYNPYGYLDRVQYASYEDALTVLSCRISQQYISKCGDDIFCIARRGYTGPGDDLQHFVSKVAWFASQV